MNTVQESLNMVSEALKPSSPSPQLDAETLIGHALRKNRAYLRAHPEHILTPEQHSQVLKNMRRRSAGEPVAYLIGKREFWSRDFRVSHDVLIPRPETELLIEITLEKFSAWNSSAGLLIGDLGSGSGAIALTLACELPNARVFASDISEPALAMAKTNAKIHECENVTFVRSHWMEHFPDLRFDLLISNPPYIADQDPHLRQGDIRFEPIIALRGGTDGLDEIGAIIQTALDYLKPGGHLILEHGCDQSQTVHELLDAAGNYSEIQHFEDLQGHLRATAARTSMH